MIPSQIDPISILSSIHLTAGEEQGQDGANGCLRLFGGKRFLSRLHVSTRWDRDALSWSKEGLAALWSRNELLEVNVEVEGLGSGRKILVHRQIDRSRWIREATGNRQHRSVGVGEDLTFGLHVDALVGRKCDPCPDVVDGHEGPARIANSEAGRKGEHIPLERQRKASKSRASETKRSELSWGYESRFSYRVVGKNLSNRVSGSV
jgi:hypothetical protein